jgi:prophage antirepressor-like protein
MNSNVINELSVRINNKDLQIRLQGTSDCPYFCGKDICTVLDYKDMKDSLQRYVDHDNKKSLKNLNDEVNVYNPPTSLGTYIPNLSHNDGRAVYINEKGLYNLLNSSRSPNKVQLRAFIDQFLYDLRYKSGMMDIFSFMKGKDIEIDVQSEWFQDLWYPLSNRTHSVATMRVLSWLGYEGEYAYPREYACF